MQEASSRVISNGDIVGYDTDLVGAYGMMCDVSRTWICGDRPPSAQQLHVFDLARHQVESNIELMTVGTSFHDLTHKAFMPSNDDYRHYSVLFHGVGQVDEYPDIIFPENWDEWGFDGHLEAGMVLTVEAFVGSRNGGPGAKLENQVLVTDAGPVRLDNLVSNDLVLSD
jgi:Xaa-Pro dipeptidase